MYSAVADWAMAPPALAETEAMDVDFDGEDEFVLRNDRVMAVFEALGGRCVGAWSLAANGEVVQVIGNPLSQPAYEDEREGDGNLSGGEVLARRTSAFKDWFADGSGGGTTGYVNDLYGVTPTTQGWTFTSGDGAITKVVTLANGADELLADYSLSGGVNKLFVRFGISPDLDSLLVRGQSGLSIAPVASGVEVSNTTPTLLTRSVVGLDANATWQSLAMDDEGLFDTVAMRNQAQVQQVEVESQDQTFSLSLSLEVVVLDGDGDGLPADWEASNGLDDSDPTGVHGAAGDPDGDGISNLDEWLVGLDPQVADAGEFPVLTISLNAGSPELLFPTLPDRIYQLEVSDDLESWDDHGLPKSTVGAGGPDLWVIDDLPAAVGARFYRMTVSAP